ncbi:hypothetical protein OHS81_34950 [Streptomyces sp. NBC_00400]|uniref:hypothetical protein n=1 Tax=Streptomyces sp. NBC_00400 TaxID=2975737 RepID=UPI002E24D4B9
MAAAPPRDFEGLTAVRRRLGGQGTKLRFVRDTLVAMTDFVEALGDALQQEDRAADEYGNQPRQAPVIDNLLAVPAHAR